MGAGRSAGARRARRGRRPRLDVPRAPDVRHHARRAGSARHRPLRQRPAPLEHVRPQHVATAVRHPDRAAALGDRRPHPLLPGRPPRERPARGRGGRAHVPPRPTPHRPRPAVVGGGRTRRVARPGHPVHDRLRVGRIAGRRRLHRRRARPAVVPRRALARARRAARRAVGGRLPHPHPPVADGDRVRRRRRVRHGAPPPAARPRRGRAGDLPRALRGRLVVLRAAWSTASGSSPRHATRTAAWPTSSST